MAAKHLHNKECWISIITELELFAKKGLSANDIALIEKFLADCFVSDINHSIKQITKQLLQKYSIKMPDAIIAASSLHLGLPLLTSDKGFVQIEYLEVILITTDS